MMSPSQLEHLSAKYLWWKTPATALQDPDRVVAQVMNLGEWDDVLQLLSQYSVEDLVRVLQAAPAGVFSMRSWSYWHYRLGLTAPTQTSPPLPQRHTP